MNNTENPNAAARAAAPVSGPTGAADIPTWRERQEASMKAGRFVGFPGEHMEAEIADLRARLSAAPVVYKATVSGQGAMTDEQITYLAMHTMDHANLGKGDDTTNSYQFSHANLKQFAQKIIDSRPRSEDSRAALAPFAAIADLYAGQEDDTFKVHSDFHIPETHVTLGQCRAARAALASSAAPERECSPYVLGVKPPVSIEDQRKAMQSAVPERGAEVASVTEAFEFCFRGESIAFDGDEWSVPATYRRLLPIAMHAARLAAAPERELMDTDIKRIHEAARREWLDQREPFPSQDMLFARAIARHLTATPAPADTKGEGE